jgi:hypothetical protein
MVEFGCVESLRIMPAVTYVVSEAKVDSEMMGEINRHPLVKKAGARVRG